MAIQYILTQVGFKMGLNPSVSGDRAVMLRFVNSAARELYNMSDMAGVLEEQCFKVNANQTIALPEYVGPIRAMREMYSHIAINLSQMRPRYNQYNWTGEWRDWRIKGPSALQASLKNQSKLLLTVKAVEDPPMVVDIAGPIDGSSRGVESVTMDSVNKYSANSYLDVSYISKGGPTTYDLIVSDVDGNQISSIANNNKEAKFQIVDISTSPWFPNNVNPLFGWVEVLYKRALLYLSSDTDEFPASGYDDVIVAKTLQLWFEEQQNIQVAVSYYGKSQQLLAQIHEDANRGTDDCVALVENGHDKITHRTGFGRDWRYGYRIVGR